jgi:CheY-like chemotaxis protein
MARILVVDDNDPVRWTLATLLRSRGHMVDQAADGRQALACFAVNRFDVVLMDVHMPCMNGLEACQRLRQQSPVPILMISTNPDPSIQKYALDCGATAFVPKPLSFDGLLSWISSVMSNGRGLTYASPACV